MHHLRRLLRSSRASRALFAFIGVMTVWNLGCVGFQPLLGSMMGSSASAGVVCDAEGMLVTPTTASSQASVSEESSVKPAVPTNVNSTVAAAPTDRDAAGQSMNCGCQSCCAPPSAPRILAVANVAVPLAPIGNHVTPPSISRTPLVPPPQAIL
jgi:hypothetical protein